MAAPTFNALTIFNSIDASDASFFQGMLWIPEYSAIRQTIHFNGADGDVYLAHGYPDRGWIYRGYISHADTDVDSLYTLLSNIQDYIDEAVSDETTYHALVDSLGNPFDKAQIHSMKIQDIRIAVPGFIAQVEVTGIIKGMQHDGPAGSSG